MSKIVPTISSGTAGPLGVLHMPRFWQKASLAAVGKLHDEYPACGAGYDQMLLDALGLDKEETLGYINANKPSYTQFEAWVSSKVGSIDASEFNAGVTGYIHDDDTRAEILGSCGLQDTGAIKDAVNLNNLDDWQIFWAQEVSG